MNKYQKSIYYLYIVIAFLFIIFTTNYLSLHDIIYVANQTDGISYNEIAKIAPHVPKENSIIIKHVGQRFLIPYIIGSAAYFLNIDYFIIFKIVTFVSILIYIFLINLIVIKFNLKCKESILFFSLLFLNPYIIRYQIFNPLQAHDILFFCLSLAFVLTIIQKKFLSNLLTTTITIYLRQSSIALFIGSIIILLINKQIKLLIILIFLFSISFLLIIKTGEIISIDKFPIRNAYGIIFYDFRQTEKLIKFLLLAILPFFPLLVILFGNINKNIDNYTIIAILIVCLLLITQPILGGPDYSTNNVGRIANLSYPILTVLCFYVFNFKKFIKNKFFFYSFVVGMFLWSLHPTFSIFKIFAPLRFYNY